MYNNNIRILQHHKIKHRNIRLIRKFVVYKKLNGIEAWFCSIHILQKQCYKIVNGHNTHYWKDIEIIIDKNVNQVKEKYNL